MEIQKRAADGTPYTVNNSTATFRLDVAKPDEHSRLVFTNDAAALTYCRERGLSAMTSVQLIQSKLKQFDDQLCAALELAMEERRVQALTRLLDALKRERLQRMGCITSRKNQKTLRIRTQSTHKDDA